MEIMIRRRVKMMMIVIIMLIMMMMVTMTMTNILVIWVATTPSEMAPQWELQRPHNGKFLHMCNQLMKGMDEYVYIKD